ncbi:MAG: class I SAM-dependent methyltransferase [Myxococcales bacterium]|nr:class I SAM-dependent methyltransferase [Myxococcales bacterium]
MAAVDPDDFLAQAHAAAPGRTAAVWRQGVIDGASGNTYQWLAEQLRHCQRVLDVGGGDGALAMIAQQSRRADAAGQAWTTLDMSAAELALCDRNATDVAQANAQAMPFADASFDGMASHLGVTVMSEPARVIAEIARVIESGGTLALVTGGGPKVGSLLESALELALPFAGDVPRLGSTALRDPQKLRAMFAPTLWRDVQLADLVIDFPRDLVLPWLLSQYEFASLDAAAISQLTAIISTHVAAAPADLRATAAVIGLVAMRS